MQVGIWMCLTRWEKCSLPGITWICSGDGSEMTKGSMIKRNKESCEQDSPPSAGRFSDIFPSAAVWSRGVFLNFPWYKKSQTVMIWDSATAEEGSRTLKVLLPHGPEPCASANSATSAFCCCRVVVSSNEGYYKIGWPICQLYFWKNFLTLPKEKKLEYFSKTSCQL